MLFDMIVAIVLVGAIDAAGPEKVVTAKPCAGGEVIQVVGKNGDVLYNTCKY